MRPVDQDLRCGASIQVPIAIRSSWRVAQARRSRTFFRSSTKKLSMAALSPAHRPGPARPDPAHGADQVVTCENGHELP
ncbi:hypothetical protein QFZ63_000274 [Streptomyces sp. B3I7]|nr:hypothetical protein [Streptomyces sp. B3I7]